MVISQKELGYVSSWSNRVPYPGKEYALQALNDLKRCLDLYKDKYLNSNYNICLSNGEEVELSIFDKNIAHMLGIPYKNLMGDYHTKFRKDFLKIDADSKLQSYDLLNIIANNTEDLVQYEETNRVKLLNYYAIMIKCAIFSKMSDLSSFDFGCINLNKDLGNFTFNSSKLLYSESGESNSPYFMMGILDSNEKDEVESTAPLYVVETLFAPSKPKQFFDKQEVVIPTQLICNLNGNLIKKSATSEDKLKLLKSYKALVNEYQVDNNLNVKADYELVLTQMKK